MLDSAISRSKGPFVLGDRLTYVDFSTLAIANQLEFLFGARGNALLAARPALASLVATLRARPNIQAYFASDRAPSVLPKAFRG